MLIKMKKVAVASMLVLPFVMGSVSAQAGNDLIERQIYQDKNFASIQQKAIQKLEKLGYEVVDVEADDYRNKPALSIEAYKNNQEYDIKLSYPDLTILKERVDY